MTTLQQNRTGLGSYPALLIIDATYGFASPDSPCGIDASLELSHIARLLDAFRQRGLPVAYSVNAYRRDTEASVFREKLPALNFLADGSRWCEIHPAVSPLSTEIVLRKTVPSIFFDTDLRQRLKDLNVDSVVVCGFSTSGCVRASAVDALQCNFRVVVAADACGDRDQEAHQYNLRDIDLKTGDVMDTKAVLELLQKYPFCV
ncbi:isochorismatase family protein [Denitratisoma oestradiolicum]|uniref:Hydrolase, isochorismatase family protein n=1 Tax=Denitratisoma oestradiolicum TaxID=311182 RepID=A0A6S6XX57_9PROT|nr:isochorismatase family protein [Denitratisoma oestradiolicum]TWO79846.1 hypothetical protein CBW56_13095 [Denitratisoma oestradiolicum]CAB1369544.1 Hydrolase, isochorismatase family protein [Denitratisoma oestradiolicum]